VSSLDRARILHAAAGDDHRSLAEERRRGIGNFTCVGRLAADAVDLLRKQLHRIVIGPALHILRQAEKRRAAIGRIEHGGNRRGQRLDDLRRMGDPVPIAADRLERIVQSHGRIAEMLKLLQHRVGQPGEKDVAAQHQHRQPVGMRQRGRCQKVGGARARPTPCRT
jgi:hypothetical protein